MSDWTTLPPDGRGYKDYMTLNDNKAKATPPRYCQKPRSFPTKITSLFIFLLFLCASCKQSDKRLDDREPIASLVDSRLSVRNEIGNPVLLQIIPFGLYGLSLNLIQTYTPPPIYLFQTLNTGFQVAAISCERKTLQY